MSSSSNPELRKGCLVFVLIVVALAILSGVSVLMLGKKTGPKARTVIISKPQTRFAEISAKLDTAIPEETKLRFLEVLKLYLTEIERVGALHSEGLVKSSEYLNEIQHDGKINAEEANSWSEMTEGLFRGK